MLNFSELRHRTQHFYDDDYILTSKCMSSDGRYIATAIDDSAYRPVFYDDLEAESYFDSLKYLKRRPHIKVWDIWEHRVVKEIRDHDTYIVRFSNDNKYLLSCGYDFIKVWDTKTWEVINQLKFEGNIVKVLFSPDNVNLVIATSYFSKGRLYVYDAENFSLKKELDVNSDFDIKKDDFLFFNYDGRYFIYSNCLKSKGNIIIWDASSWNIVKMIGDTPVKNIVASHNSNLIALDKCGKSISILNLENFEEAEPQKANEPFETDYPLAMVFSPDNRFLFIHSDKNCLSVFSTSTTSLYKCFKNMRIHWMDFNADGDLIIGYDCSNSKAIKVIDIENWSEIFDVKGIFSFGNDIEFDNRNDILATNMYQKYVLLLRTTKRSLEKYLKSERSEEDYFEFDFRDGVGEYDYDARGNIDIGGGYDRHGYNREGYNEEGLDEWGYDEDMNGAYD